MGLDGGDVCVGSHQREPLKNNNVLALDHSHNSHLTSGLYVCVRSPAHSCGPVVATGWKTCPVDQ